MIGHVLLFLFVDMLQQSTDLSHSLIILIPEDAESSG